MTAGTRRIDLRFQADSSHESCLASVPRQSAFFQTIAGRTTPKDFFKIREIRSSPIAARFSIPVFLDIVSEMIANQTDYRHALRSLRTEKDETIVLFVLVKSSVKTRLARMNPREECSLSSQKFHAQKTLSSSGGELLPFHRELFSIRDSSVPGSPCFRDFRCHFLSMGQTMPRACTREYSNTRTNVRTNTLRSYWHCYGTWL